MDGKPPEKDRNFVTALARGLDVLRAFRPSEIYLTNTDFAERTGLPKPTVSRLTYTLCQLDYLVADPKTGAYRLGTGVLGLGFGVLSGIEIGDRAKVVMEDLCSGPNPYTTCALAERHGLTAVYLVVERSRQDVSLTLSVGAHLPLFQSAIGRAILVAMEPDQQRAAIEQVMRDDPTGASGSDMSLVAAQQEFARKGYCASFGEWREDVNGIAVPVRSMNARRVFALNIGGPAFHVSARELEDHYAPRLIEAASAIAMTP